MTIPGTTYVWLTGHVRNVGDSVLRRPFCSALRNAGPLRVWTGDPAKHYEQNLGLQPGESVPSFIKWYGSFVKQVLLTRPNFAFNAGEFGVTKAYFFGMVCLVPWLVVLRLKGGAVVWVGASVAAPRPGFMWPFRTLVRLATMVVWRDLYSPKLMNVGGLMPDWAFALAGGRTIPLSTLSEGDSSDSRDYARRNCLAISLRGDQKYPATEWVSAVRSLAERLDLVPIIVVQVEDDEGVGRQLQADLAAECISWPREAGHQLGEEMARDAYRRSRIILSDRLHALIIGATEGAVPLAWCAQRNEKIARHFGAVGADWVSRDFSDSMAGLAALDRVGLGELEDESWRMVAAARTRVEDTASVLTAHLRRPPTFWRGPGVRSPRPVRHARP